jgi:dTDP-4-amino-4,6-dideoxygalactose transaminase
MLGHLDYEYVFKDIDMGSWLMFQNKLPKKPHAETIFPTHTFGNTLELEEPDDYRTVFDGAHSLGSEIREFGAATVLSLAPTKLVTSCEGGLVLTNHKYLEDFVRFRRDKCARMSEVHALVGLKTLFYLDRIKSWKNGVFNYYSRQIPGQFQEVPYDSNYNTIGFLNTEHLKIPEHIETRQYYSPIYYMELLPNAFEVYKNIVCLPSWYGVDFRQIVEDIKEANDL